MGVWRVAKSYKSQTTTVCLRVVAQVEDRVCAMGSPQAHREPDVVV